jgi:hypothetical protein
LALKLLFAAGVALSLEILTLAAPVTVMLADPVHARLLLVVQSLAVLFPAVLPGPALAQPCSAQVL